jgi:hypothetical protein
MAVLPREWWDFARGMWATPALAIASLAALGSVVSAIVATIGLTIGK